VITTKETDGKVRYSMAGPTEIHLEYLSSFDIKNIQDVESHQINRVFNSVSHYIKFLNGGEARISYIANGELLEFWGKSINIEIIDGERVVISSLSR
jgi:hypothetical protein